MSNAVAILDQMRKELDRKEKKERPTTYRIQGYLKAIENGETEKYWDYQDVWKGRMSYHDYMIKWHGMKDKRDTKKESRNGTIKSVG